MNNKAVRFILLSMLSGLFLSACSNNDTDVKKQASQSELTTEPTLKPEPETRVVATDSQKESFVQADKNKPDNIDNRMKRTALWFIDFPNTHSEIYFCSINACFSVGCLNS